MKAVYLHTIGAIALTFGIAACVPASSPPAPTPPPVVRPAPTPTPAPVVQAPVYDSWMDAPQTPGNWEYARFPFGSQALFNGRDTAQSFAIACIIAERRITLMRPLAVADARPMTVRSETATRNLDARPAAGGAPGLVASLDPRDPLLDAMALSKGRFAVEVTGYPMLYLPSWAEVTRVIEDCR